MCVSPIEWNTHKLHNPAITHLGSYFGEIKICLYKCVSVCVCGHVCEKYPDSSVHKTLETTEVSTTGDRIRNSQYTHTMHPDQQGQNYWKRATQTNLKDSTWAKEARHQPVNILWFHGPNALQEAKLEYKHGNQISDYMKCVLGRHPLPGTQTFPQWWKYSVPCWFWSQLKNGTGELVHCHT